MLSKEAIEGATKILVNQWWSKIQGDAYCDPECAQGHFENGVEAGATWVNEQYGPLLAAVETLLYGYDLENVDIHTEHFLPLKQALDNLKQIQ